MLLKVPKLDIAEIVHESEFFTDLERLSLPASDPAEQRPAACRPAKETGKNKFISNLTRFTIGFVHLTTPILQEYKKV